MFSFNELNNVSMVNSVSVFDSHSDVQMFQRIFEDDLGYAINKKTVAYRKDIYDMLQPHVILRQRAEALLGKELVAEALQERQEDKLLVVNVVVPWLYDNLPKEYFNCLYNVDGEIMLNARGLYIVFDMMVRGGKCIQDVLKGMLGWVSLYMAEQFNSVYNTGAKNINSKNIKTVMRKGSYIAKPIYNMGSSALTWNTCEVFFGNLMNSMLCPKGYTGFVLESPNMYEVLFQCDIRKDLQSKAQDKVVKQGKIDAKEIFDILYKEVFDICLSKKTGFIYDELSMDIENKFLPMIIEEMVGFRGDKATIRYVYNCRQQYFESNNYGQGTVFYDNMYKKIRYILGKAYSLLNESVKSTGFANKVTVIKDMDVLSTEDLPPVFVYHLTNSNLAIGVRDNLVEDFKSKVVPLIRQSDIYALIELPLTTIEKSALNDDIANKLVNMMILESLK